MGYISDVLLEYICNINFCTGFFLPHPLGQSSQMIGTIKREKEANREAGGRMELYFVFNILCCHLKHRTEGSGRISWSLAYQRRG